MRTDEALAVREAAMAIARSRRWDLPADLAEEVAQETVLRFVAQPEGSIDDPVRWANTTAGHLCADYWRRSRRLVAQDDPLDEEVSTRALMRFLDDGVPTSLAALQAQQASALLAGLTPRERALIALVAEGVPQAEIAVELGYANADSVKATLNRLRRKLLGKAADLGVDEDWQDHPRVY